MAKLTSERIGSCRWRGLRYGSPLLWRCRCPGFTRTTGPEPDDWPRCICGHTQGIHTMITTTGAP